MRKLYYVTLFLAIFIVCFLGITYSYEYDNDDNIDFKLIGPATLYIDANTEYEEYGVKVTFNGKDISDRVTIDSSSIDITKLGEYKVKYEFGDQYIYRKVVVIDRIKPVINLIGGEELVILLNGTYKDAGYIVTDNYDTDLQNKVVVSGKVDTSHDGTYTISYKVSDKSANEGVATRTVIVKRDTVSDKNIGNRVTPTSNVTLYSNTIIRNKFTSYGIYYEGYVRNNNGKYKIIIKNRNTKDEYVYEMSTSSNKNYYSGNLNLAIVSNGTYDVYISSNSDEKLINKLDNYHRIIRAKVGKKLVSLIYDNDYVTIVVDDFVYEYDVAIDPGHGGSDTGAANYQAVTTKEKDLNLKVSKYEKCRYESMGYKVYMTRYDDTYGELIGDKSLEPLDRRALTFGYYGAVSRVAYSNHHNGSESKKERGFEILVSNHLNAKELAQELSLYKKFMTFYNINDSRKRIYSKDYNTSEIYSKAKGEVYNKEDFYSMIRIPYMLYNIKTVIYEPVFIDNNSDFNWYMKDNNWIKISEMKIEEYVKYMGGEYNPDNKMCL